MGSHLENGNLLTALITCEKERVEFEAGTITRSVIWGFS